MDNQLTIILYGDHDLNLKFNFSKAVNYYYVSPNEVPLSQATITLGRLKNQVYLLGPTKTPQMYYELLTTLPAYQILYEASLASDAELYQLLSMKKAYSFDFTNQVQLGQTIENNFFPKQLGFKLLKNDIEINDNFSGVVEQIGNYRLKLTANFDQQMNKQLLYWRMNYTLMPGSYEFYSEFDVATLPLDAVVFSINLIRPGSSDVIGSYNIRGKQLEKPFEFYVTNASGCYIYVSCFVEHGQGSIEIGDIHVRQARGKYGELVLGGKRLVDYQDAGSELLYYFNPGDLKPPLCVYFSGYRTAEGFEGMRMLKRIKAPFLLIADPRLEGGDFYIADKKVEVDLVNVILNHLTELGFSNNQLILSGLSMGTYGALRYATKLRPHAVVIGKPLVNLGTIAANERINRAGGFPTALDILIKHTGDVDDHAQKKLNDFFWNDFKEADFSETQFAIAYMLQDDYDSQAFEQLFKYLKFSFPSIRLLYKGLIGRHNDDTAGINKWFIAQYARILTNDFKR